MSIEIKKNLAGLTLPGRFGLGHSLLAWARCVLWCKDHQAVMLPTQWLQPRLGPYLRGERDKRQYHRLFATGLIEKFHKVAWLILAKRYEEVQSEQALSQLGRRVVLFRNDYEKNERRFADILGRQDDVRTALENAASAEGRLSSNEPTGFIGIHVRRGDFSKPSDETLSAGANSLQLPLDWYVQMAQRLSQSLPGVPLFLFSDGQDGELAPLLALPGLRRIENNALRDIQLLSRAAVIVASGSGFSLWATYLGQVPRVCFPRQRKLRLLGEPTQNNDLEPECASANELSPNFLTAIATRIIKS